MRRKHNLLILLLLSSAGVRPQILSPIMFGENVHFDYFISTSGNDSCNGTSPAIGSSGNCAWLTIPHAESAASSGKNVSISQGTYTIAGGWLNSHTLHWYGHGNVIVNQSGASGSVVVVTSSGSSWSGIKFDGTGAGFNIVQFNAGASSPIFTLCSFTSVPSDGAFETTSSTSGFLLSASSINGHPSVALFYGQFINALITGNTITQTSGTSRSLIRTKAASSIIFNANTVTASPDSTQPWINLGFADSLTANSNIITIATQPAAIIQTQSSGTGFLSFTGNTVNHVGTASSAPFNVRSGGVEAVTFTGNTITDSNSSQGSSLTEVLIINQITPIVSNNSIDTSGPQDSIDIHSTGAVTCGISTVNGNTLTIRNVNVFHGIVIGEDNSSAGDGFCSGPVVTNNVIHGFRFFTPTDSSANNLHAILIGYQINCTCTGNTIVGSGYGLVLKNAGVAWTSGLVGYNIIWNQMTLQPFPSIYMKGASSVPVYNNTIWMGLTDSPVSDNNATPIKDDTNSGSAINNLIKNNIIAGVDIGNVFAWDSGGSGNVFDYNLYYASNSFGQSSFGGGFGYNGSFRATFAAWVASGEEPHGVNANPLFTNPSAGDFTLQPGSPAIGAGIFIPGVSTANPPNIGAK